MFDEFLYKYRYYIGGVLIAVILAGIGSIAWDKLSRKNIAKENNVVSELKAQNEALRLELSNQARQQVAGSSIVETSVSNKININAANVTELDRLPGIGPARAADIINYRDSHGGFKSIEEMKNIKGIGDKTFESMKDLITIGN